MQIFHFISPTQRLDFPKLAYVWQINLSSSEKAPFMELGIDSLNKLLMQTGWHIFSTCITEMMISLFSRSVVSNLWIGKIWPAWKISFSAHTQILAEHKCCFYILTQENVRWFKLGDCPSCYTSYVAPNTSYVAHSNWVLLMTLLPLLQWSMAQARWMFVMWLTPLRWWPGSSPWLRWMGSPSPTDPAWTPPIALWWSWPLLTPSTIWETSPLTQSTRCLWQRGGEKGPAFPSTSPSLQVTPVIIWFDAPPPPGRLQYWILCVHL